MRATVISTGRHFSIVRTLEGQQDIHVPTDKVKRVEFRQGSKEPMPAVRHIRPLKKGEIVEVFETEGKLRQERGKIILPTALAVGFEDEIELLKIAGPNGRAESYWFIADVIDGNGQVVESSDSFEGSLRELLDKFPADRDVRITRPLKSKHPTCQVALRFAVKLKGKETFVSCPDPRLWHLPEPEQPKPTPTPAKNLSAPTGSRTTQLYWVKRYSIDSVTMATVEEELASGISPAEYQKDFRDELDDHLGSAMTISVVVRELNGLVWHAYTRYNPQYQVKPESAVVATASA